MSSDIIPFRLSKTTDNDLREQLESAEVKTHRIKELMRHGIKYESLLNLGFSHEQLEDKIPFEMDDEEPEGIQSSADKNSDDKESNMQVVDEIVFNMPNVTRITIETLKEKTLAGA